MDHYSILFLSVVLFLPDQIHELYRIAADDPGWPVFKEFLAIALIAIAIWLGAFQLATESRARMPAATGRLALYIKLLPVVLGALPIVAAIAGQFVSRPDDPRLTPEKMNSIREVGSIFRIQNMALASEQKHSFFSLSVFFSLLARSWPSHGALDPHARSVNASTWANRKYFGRLRFLAAQRRFDRLADGGIHSCA